jgi:predicted MPP superfamily phosphohydrolase
MISVKRVVSAAAAVGVAAAGAEALSLRRRERDLPLPGMPAELEGLTVLHVSDVHAGYGPGLAHLRRSAAWAHALQPDLIALTGDLVARRSAARGFAEAAAELVAAARLGAYAVLGNHDLARGNDPFAQGWDADDLGGMTLLDGRAVEVAAHGRRISIAGASVARVMRPGPYDPASHLDPSADLRILLCHYPHLLPRLRSGWAHLVLSGHLHGGQICLPWPGGRIGLAHPRAGTIATVEACNGTVMHVSPGIGTTFVPVRFLARPEVTLLRLTAPAA